MHSKENVTTNVNLKLTETRKLLEARENASDHFEIGCSFESDWLREGASFVDQFQREGKQWQRTRGGLSTYYIKSILLLLMVGWLYNK